MCIDFYECDIFMRLDLTFLVFARKDKTKNWDNINKLMRGNGIVVDIDVPQILKMSAH